MYYSIKGFTISHSCLKEISTICPFVRCHFFLVETLVPPSLLNSPWLLFAFGSFRISWADDHAWETEWGTYLCCPLRVSDTSTKDWTDKANQSKVLASPILKTGVLRMAPSSLWTSCLGCPYFSCKACSALVYGAGSCMYASCTWELNVSNQHLIFIFIFILLANSLSFHLSVTGAMCFSIFSSVVMCNRTERDSRALTSMKT